MAPHVGRAVRRILILGSAGAGKSTVATQLSAILGLPLIHLDAFFWRAGWRESPRDEWKQRVATLLTQDAWIMDGNYLGTLVERLAVADTVILLDIPRIRCIYRVVRRALRDRGKQRADLAEGCVEQFPDWAFIRWIWAFPRDDLRPILDELKTHTGTKTVVVLRSTAEIRKFVSIVAGRRPRQGRTMKSAAPAT